MTTISGFMRADHARLDTTFEEFKRLGNDEIDRGKSLFFDFNAGLRRHIIWEEDILFPIFERATGMHDSGPTEVMRMEHRQIKQILEEIKEKVTAGILVGIQEAENGLLEVLGSHNQKEENILYPAIDQLSDEEQTEQVISRMADMAPVA